MDLYYRLFNWITVYIQEVNVTTIFLTWSIPSSFIS